MQQAWETAGRGDGFLTAPWELYNVNEDFSQSENLAAKEPAKLQELQAKFLEEAKKYGVFPLDPRFSERMDPKLRIAGDPKTSWTYYGNSVWLPEPIGPQLFPRPHSLTADLVIPKGGGADGVIACAGAFSAGWSLYIKDGKPNFRYTFFDVADVTIAGSVNLPEGKVTVKTEFTPDGTKQGSGTLKMFVNGAPAGEGKLKRSVFRHGLEPFEVGRDSITPVSPDYKTPFGFTGTIEKITFELTKNLDYLAAVGSAAMRSRKRRYMYRFGILELHHAAQAAASLLPSPQGAHLSHRHHRPPLPLFGRVRLLDDAITHCRRHRKFVASAEDEF